MLYEAHEISVPYAAAGIRGTGHPVVYAYVRDRSREMTVPPRPALLICPGGAYSFTSDREAEPIALEFLRRGFQCFVLRYSTAESTVFPGALLETAAAVVWIREHAEEWNMDPHAVMVCGFSAGGHLAASLGVFWDKEFVNGPLSTSGEQIRPDGLILGYPVITSGEFRHQVSFECLLGERYEEPGLLELVSLEHQVSEQMPPAFLWHTWDDGGVPVENSLLFANALRTHGIPFEMHILPSGSHGMSLGTAETGMISEACSPWVDWAERWVRSLPKR